MLRRSFKVKAKFGFGKERKQTDSEVYYGLLGGVLSITENLSSSNPSSLVLAPSLVAFFFSFLFLFFFYRSLAAGWVRKAGWREGPLSASLL